MVFSRVCYRAKWGEKNEKNIRRSQYTAKCKLILAIIVPCQRFYCTVYVRELKSMRRVSSCITQSPIWRSCRVNSPLLHQFWFSTEHLKLAGQCQCRTSEWMCLCLFAALFIVSGSCTERFFIRDTNSGSPGFAPSYWCDTKVPTIP